MAEIELNVMTRQCLTRRIADIDKLRQELAAWETDRNHAGADICWHFTTDNARAKLVSLYLRNDDSPTEEMIRSVKILEGAGVNKIIIGCVTAHYYIDKIKKYCVKSKIVNVVEETEEYINKNYSDIKKIGIICSRGAQKVGIWDKYLEEKHITPIYLSDINQAMIFEEIIYGKRGVKSGFFAENKRKLEHAIKCLKEVGADIVLGSCSELQMIQRSNLEIGYLDVFDITINKIVAEYYNNL